MDQETMEKQREKARNDYVPPKVEVFATDFCRPLAGSPFAGDHLQGADGSDGSGSHMRGLGGWIDFPKDEGLYGSHDRGYTSEDGNFHLRGNAADW